MLDATVTEDSSDSVDQGVPSFVRASEFVDAAIDAVDNISELPVEAFVALTVLQIARNPQEVRINVTKAQKLIIIELDVAVEDVAHLIGKRGHTIDSIRSLVSSSAGRDNVEYMIYLLGDGKSTKHFSSRPPRRFSRFRDDQF